MDRKQHKGSKPHITDEKLKQELENGKTQKEIAHEYGYGYPSRVLSDKIRELGYTKNQKMTLDKHGSFQAYVSSEIVSESLQKKNLQDQDQRFFKTNVRQDGVIEIIPTGKKWRRED